MILNNAIKDVLSYESTKRSWRNVHDSKEFLLASKVALNVMGQQLGRSKNCGCIEDLFIMLKSLTKEKINLKQIQMENKFRFKEGVLLGLEGTHYTNANLTDDKAIAILRKFPTQISNFENYPTDWKELVNGNSRELELSKMELSDLFAIAQEIADNKGIEMIHAKSRSKKVINFILINE